MTSTYLALVILTIWILAGLLAFLPVFGWKFNSNRLYIADAIGISVIILVSCCYIRIYYLVRKRLYPRDRRETEERRAERQCLLTDFMPRMIEKIKRRERSVALSVFILVGLFAVCWIPALVVENIKEFCGNLCVSEKLQIILEASVLLHPLANPIAYSLRTVKFRRALWRICKCSANRRSPRQEVV